MEFFTSSNKKALVAFVNKSVRTKGLSFCTFTVQTLAKPYKPKICTCKRKLAKLCFASKQSEASTKQKLPAPNEQIFALQVKGKLSYYAEYLKKIEWSQLFTWTYFLFFLIVPICALLAKAFAPSVHGHRFVDFFHIATQPIALSAYSVTFSMAFVASLFNAFFGFVLAWVLVRYHFPGKRFLDAAIDLPFAVPTSVAGLTLATVYSPQGWIGEALGRLGIEVVYTRLGVATAMVFVSLPFVVRSLQPVLQEIDEQIEESAWSLGASPYTTFRKVLFPPLLPAFLTGVTLGFSRAIGEYGSLVLVSSNIPYKDLIASVLIFQNLEQYSLGEATVIATVVLLISFSILLGVSSIQSWNRNKQG